MPTRKLMDPQMLRQEHYFSYKTPPSWQIFLLQLRYFMDVPHKEQSLSRPSKPINIHQIWQRLIEIQDRQKEQLTKPTELRIYEFSRLRSKYSSSQTNKGQALDMDDWNCD